MRATFTTALGKRENNEDAWLVDKTRGVFAVADGLGGHDGGEEAAQIAVCVVLRTFEAASASAPVEPTLVGAVAEANRIIGVMGRKIRKPEMGSTIVALAFEPAAGPKRPREKAVVAWVGDSRCYRLRDGQLEQLSKDHSHVAFLLETGRIQPEEAATHPARGQLLRTLGEHGVVTADTRVLDVKRRDVFLLCSDGLTDALGTDVIAEVLLARGNAQALVDRALALEREEQDNLTAIVVRL